MSAKKNDGVMKKLAPYIAPYKGKMITAVALGILGSLMNIFIPDYIKKISEVIEAGISSGIDFNKIGFLSCTGIILVVLASAFDLIQAFIMSNSANKIVKTLRSEVSNKMDHVTINYYDTTNLGDTMSRATGDIQTITKALSGNISLIASSGVLILGCIVMMFYNSWILAIAVLLSTLFGMICNGKFIKIGRKKSKSLRVGIGNINGIINESFTGHLIIKAFNCEDEVLEDFHRVNDQLETDTWKSEFYTKVMAPVMDFVNNLSYIVVCVLGGILLINHKTEVGVIAAFILYVKMFSNPLAKLFQAIGNIQPAMACAERVFEFLELEDEPDAGNNSFSKNVKGEVSFEHISFGYIPGQTILKDFSATVKPGMKVAIVGPTGAGKSTIVNLLMRFYELNGGKIFIDGTPITDISRKDLHEILGMVLQETWCFDGTIRENIVYSTPGVSEARLNQVVDEVGLRFMVDALPQGLDTYISEGSSVSAGQKQLITIARAMIKNSPILILDEATSSVDTRTEQYIQRSIDMLCEGRTSFVIAHRLSTIQNADIIFVLKDGDIIEMGTHDELLAKGGFYNNLYNSQFDNN